MKKVYFVIVGWTLFLASWSFNIGITVGRHKTLDAKKIADCFKGEWNVQTFTCGEIQMTDKNGETKFYSVPEIDEKIAKLQKLLNEN